MTWSATKAPRGAPGNFDARTRSLGPVPGLATLFDGLMWFDMVSLMAYIYIYICVCICIYVYIYIYMYLMA